MHFFETSSFSLNNNSAEVGVKALSKCHCVVLKSSQVGDVCGNLILSASLRYSIDITFLIAQYSYPISLLAVFSMASSCTHPRKRRVFEHSAKESRNSDYNPSTKFPSRPKEIALRTSLLRDSVKRRIFAYMDKGDRSAAIETKSGLSHPTVKLYRRMWNGEKHDARRRSKKTSRRKSWARVLSHELFRLPFHLKSASDQKPGFFHVAKGIKDKEKRTSRAASGSKERDTSPKGEDAGSKVEETSSVHREATSFSEFAILGSTQRHRTLQTPLQWHRTLPMHAVHQRLHRSLE